MKISVLAFLFLFGFSIGIQLAKTRIEYTPESSLVENYLLNEFNVTSVAEYRLKLEREIYENYNKSVEQYLAGYSTPSTTETGIYEYKLKSSDVDPKVDLSTFLLSGISFAALLLFMVPKFGKKLQERKLIYWLITLFSVFGLAFSFGLALAQTSGRTIYLEDLPATATYVINTDGLNVWATRYDGKVAFNGTDASTVIQSALNSLTNGRTWKERIVVKGNFELSKTLSVDSYTILNIQGKLKLGDNKKTHMIKVDGKKEVDIIGGELDGNKVNNAASTNLFGIWITNASNRIRIEDLTVHDVKDLGITVYGGSSTVYSTDILIRNNIAYNNGRDGIALDDYHRYVDIVGNIVYGNGHWGIGAARYVRFANVIGNIAHDNLGGIYISNVDSFMVCGNLMRNNLASGMIIDYGAKYVSVTGNFLMDDGIYSNTASLQLGYSLNGAVSFVTVHDNLILGRRHGIVIKYGSKKIDIKGNFIVAGYDGNNTYDGIRITNATQVSVKGNRICGLSSAARSKHGVNEISPSDYNFIVDNEFYDIGTSAVVWSGSSTVVKRNLGFVTENSGTATVANNQWVLHGLATAPSNVLITCRTATYGNPPLPVNVYWIGQNTTHFKVGVYWTNGTAIISRAINISWYAEAGLPSVLPSFLFEDGFESGNFNAWTGISFTSGETATVVNTISFHGYHSAMFTSNGDGGYERADCYRYIASLSELYARGYFYVTTSGITDNDDRFHFIVFKAGGNNVAFAGWRKISGVVKWDLIIRDGTEWASTISSVTPLTNKWYCVELHWFESTSSGYAELFVDNVLVCSITGKNTAYYGDCNRVDFGLAEIVNCGATTVYCDCCAISKTRIGLAS